MTATELPLKPFADVFRLAQANAALDAQMDTDKTSITAVAGPSVRVTVDGPEVVIPMPAVRPVLGAVIHAMQTAARAPGDANDAHYAGLVSIHDALVHAVELAKVPQPEPPARSAVTSGPVERRWLTPETYGERTGVSARAITKACSLGQIPGAHKIAGRWLLPDPDDEEQP